MVTISQFAQVTLGTDGIWYPKSTAQTQISYLEHGNASCFEVEDGSFWFAHRNQIILQSLKKVSFDFGWLLDIGGGNGAVAAFLERHGKPVVLVEPGPAGARNARARQITAVINSTFEESHFSDDSIPAAGLFDVIEHIENDHGLLIALHKSLIPGGLIVITVPAYQFLWSHEDTLAGHFRRYSRQQLHVLLRAAGFEPILSTFFFVPLFLPILLLRTLRSKVERGKSAKGDPGQDHGNKGGISVGILKILLKTELLLLNLLSALKLGLPFGSSLLVIARKPGPGD